MWIVTSVTAFGTTGVYARTIIDIATCLKDSMGKRLITRHKTTPHFIAG